MSNFSHEKLQSLIKKILSNSDKDALSELSKNRDKFKYLATTLWYANGVVTCLIQEIINSYKLLDAPISTKMSNRICNCLALMQCIAGDKDTKNLFLRAHIPLYLYPFFNLDSSVESFEFIKVTSLGVIGSLLSLNKDDNDNNSVDIIKFLLSTEIIPTCLRIMEKGGELSKTVSTFIVQKILMFDIGLGYICATPDRFYAVASVLKNLLNNNAKPTLINHIIRCYVRLTDHQRAREILNQNLPESLQDGTFKKYLKDDPVMQKWLDSLLTILQK